MQVQGFNIEKPIIGVIYLAPSLGYKDHPGMDGLVEMALEDLEVLKKCGVDGALLENENDRPYSVLARPEVIATMSVAASRIIKHCDGIELGAEFLINDPEASIAIAKASQCSFMRTDYFVDRMSREEYGGEMRIDPVEVNAFKKRIGADDVALFTDIQVKYATMLEEKSLAQSAREAFENGSAGAVISGKETGIAPKPEDFLEARESGVDIPLIIGSGLAIDNLDELLPVLDGAIVGTAFMTDERMDYEKIAPFMDKVRSLRG